jgi:F420-dependent oxidoreductase-like protein
MDHLFQIRSVGAADEPMLEGYTTLGYVAALTQRMTLGLLVTGVMYRYPGVLAKTVTTLDVLSGGRARLGLGASWYEREQRALGVPVVSVAERFERLEETLQIANQMWSDDNNGPFDGKHYQLAETLNVPQALQKPRPRILIGGRGQQKTLRLVAKYADAYNLPGADPATARRQFDLLREHCEREDRNYDDVEKTVLTVMNVGPDGSQAGQLVEQLGRFAEAGAQAAIGALIGVENIKPIELIGRDVIPQVAAL